LSVLPRWLPASCGESTTVEYAFTWADPLP